jgi:hypothetical protein
MPFSGLIALGFAAVETGTTQVALLLNSGKLTISLGPFSVIAKGGE